MRIVIALAVVVAVSASVTAASASRPFDDAKVHVSPAKVRAGGMVSIAVVCQDGSRSAMLAGSGFLGSLDLPRSHKGRWKMKAHIPSDMNRGEHYLAVRCAGGAMGIGSHDIRGGVVGGSRSNRIQDHVHLGGGPHTGFGGLSG